MSNREAVYDEKISPLMTQIIAICKEHDIPMVASFQYNDDRPDGEPQRCTTIILNQETAPCEVLEAAARVLRPVRHQMMTLKVLDGGGNVRSVETIVT